MQRTLWCGFVLWAVVDVGATAQTIHGREGITLPAPPAVEAIPVTDSYFGTKVLDSYRWLEDGRSAETRAFIDAENAYTTRYMKQVSIHSQALDDLDALENVSEASAPLERAGSYFFRKRLAGEEQFSIYVRHGLKWTDGKGPAAKSASSANASAMKPDERLVDPAKLTRDANTSVGINDVSRDGGLLAYWVREGGADEASVHVLDVKTGKALEDELPAARYSSVTFAPDGQSLYYARNDKQGTLLYQHALGTRVSRDKLLFGHEFRGELLAGNDLFTATVTDDGRYLVVEIARGVPARRVDIVFRDLSKPDAPFDLLVWGLDSRFHAIWTKGAWYVKTDYHAPKGAILKADPGIMPDVWKTIVPEGKDVIDGWSIVGGKIYVNRLKDVKTETSIYTLDGKPAGTVEYDGIGSPSGIVGHTTDRYGYFSFSSYHCAADDLPAGYGDGKAGGVFPAESSVRVKRIRAEAGFLQVEGRDAGSDVHCREEGAEEDGSERLLMTGYGGFNLSMTPRWNRGMGVVAGAGRLVCRAQPARRRRVWRGVARGGDVREEAERLRRLVCGGANT